MHIIDFGPAVLFGIVYIFRGDLNFSKLRALTSPEAVEHQVEDEAIVEEQILKRKLPLENTAGD
jgi:hypothetical protein